MCCVSARADGLADLKAALARLQSQAPVRATLEVRTLERHGEGKNVEERAGQASLALEDGVRGFQIVVPQDALARVDAESRLLGRDPMAKAPTQWGLARLDPVEAWPMVSASSAVLRELEESSFKSERADTWQGRPARLLSFSVPVSRLPAQQRKYITQTEASLEVWIAADGTPLASSAREIDRGRAFVVITFEVRSDEDCTYGVVGDRLVMLRRELHSVSSGAGERLELRNVKTLQTMP